MNFPKKVTILGSTGTIGQKTIELIRANPDLFELHAITGGDNVQLLAKQARELQVKIAVINNKAYYQDLKTALSGTNIQVEAGYGAVIAASALHGGFVMSAIVGAAALQPTLAAIQRGCTIGLANKECFVCAGELLQKQAQLHNAKIIPVDSEHNAIFQAMNGESSKQLKKIILTSSGGPFLRLPIESLKNVTIEQALNHPKWKMGAKISIDSATMMNKGLEIIEAFHLFPVMESQIEVIVHPEHIIHGMAEYIDGSIIAQMGTPDMFIPISYALAWPERITNPAQKLSFGSLTSMNFEQPDYQKFPALQLAREALKMGANMPIVLNAANEIAVAAFLNRQISFTEIIYLVEKVLNKCNKDKFVESIEHVLTIDQDVRILTKETIKELYE